MAGFLDESKECERVNENLQPSPLSSTIYNFGMLSVSRLLNFFPFLLHVGMSKLSDVNYVPSLKT